MQWTNKTALVTGASRGLGEALAGALARRGVSVVGVAREAAPLEAAMARLRSDGGVAYALPGDLGDKRDIHRLVGAATALVGPIDLVVHNASTLGPLPMRVLAETDCEDLEAVLQVNLLGPFRLTKALVGQMVLRGDGLVVLVSSDAAMNGYPRWGAYGVSKAALDQLGRTFAAELERVRFVMVDPGEMDTRMHADAMPEADRWTLEPPARVAARLVNLIEAGRFRSGERLDAATLGERGS